LLLFLRKKVQNIALLLVLLSVATTMSLALEPFSTSKSNVAMAASLPPQGVYEDCPPADAACFTNLDQIAAGGFKLVLNYSQFWGTPAQQIAYAARADSLGMKVIWGMSDPAWWNGTNLRTYYGDLGETCNCSDNTGFIKYVVSLVKDLPGTWGYYIGDELEPAEHAKAKAFSDLVKSVDPVHPRLYVAASDLDIDNLTPFVDMGEYLATDNYPVGTGLDIGTVGSVARDGQALANKNGKVWAQVLQSFNWGQYPVETWVPSPRWPTRDEMRQMRDQALNNAQPGLLLWYSYFDIRKDPQAASHWADLVWAAGANQAPQPQPTATAAPKPTSTPVPATATPKPTSTPVPATATPRPTSTPVPTTAAPKPTSTPVPATATPKPTSTPVPTTGNLILDKTLVASNEEPGFEGSKVNDGDPNTRWRAYGWPNSIQIDLGSVKTITATDLLPYQNKAYRYRVLVSTNETKFTRVVDRSSNRTGGEVITDTFAPVKARYIRLVILGSYGDKSEWTDIKEFRVR
jgi:hypothetical protein